MNKARSKLAVVLLSGLIVAGLGWTTWLDRQAEGFYDRALSRALITFGLSRALNGIISMVQGTEVALQPAGVGATFTPGELLDPLNDLVERFSWVMLVASTSLGIQKIFMEMSAWWGMRIIVSIAILALLIAWWKGGPKTRRVVWRLSISTLFLRFAMPLMVLLNHAVYDLFMDAQYTTATRIIQDTSSDLADFDIAQREAAAEGESWWDGVGRWVGETADTLNVKKQLEQLNRRLSATIEQMLRLAAVFVLQTIVLPLLFLWALGRAMGMLRAGPTITLIDQRSTFDADDHPRFAEPRPHSSRS